MDQKWNEMIVSFTAGQDDDDGHDDDDDEGEED